MWLLLSLFAALASAKTPFTSTELTRSFDAGGKLTSETRFVYATRSDGSIASVDLDESTGNARQVIDRSRQKTYLIDPKARIVTSMGGPRIASPAAEPRDCGRRFSAQQYTIEPGGKLHGIDVQKLTVSLSDGQIQLWLAPSLGCHVLRSVAIHKGRILKVFESVSLKLGDPDPVLFEIPSGYMFTDVTQVLRR
jgi:hypothetical protein